MTQFDIECRNGGQSMVTLGSLVLGVQIILKDSNLFNASFIKLTHKK